MKGTSLRCGAPFLTIAFSVLLGTTGPVLAQEAQPDAYLRSWRQAQARSDAQDWAAAVPLWEQVVQKNPHVAWFWYSLGIARSNTGDYKRAIPALEKAQELGAGFLRSSVSYQIARAHALLGEKEAALNWLEKSLAAGFRSRERIRTDEAFKLLENNQRFKTLVQTADTGHMSRTEGWRYDLSLLETEVKRMHYDPFRKVSRTDFEKEARQLQDESANLTDNQIIVRLMRLMSRIGDGHTGCFPDLVPSWDQSIPLQFGEFSGGWEVISADPDHADLVGTRALRFGDHPVEQVIQALDRIISRDNAQGLVRSRTNYLRFPQVLNGLGLLSDAKHIPLTVEDSAGNQRTVTVAAVANDPEFNRITGHPKWITAYHSAPGSVPLYLKDRRTPYWFEPMAGSKTVYFQFNLVTNTPAETLSGFANRLFKFIDENKMEKLIIDMRWNNGGNTLLLPPLIQAVIRSEQVNGEGDLFVIVGRYTYSAAMNAATMLERDTNAILVGEPTPSSPNFIGESNLITLPYSRVRVSISDIYWQTSWPTDHRTWIAPLLYVPPSFDAYRTNRDPAMELVTAYRAND